MKTTNLTIRLTTEEKDELTANAEKYDYRNISDFIRSVAIKKENPKMNKGQAKLIKEKITALSHISKTISMSRYFKVKFEHQEKVINEIKLLEKQLEELSRRIYNDLQPINQK